jgi:hypothetical protein
MPKPCRARHPDRKIRHAVDEDLPRLAPAKRLEEGVGVEGDAEAGPGGAGVAAGLVFRLAHGLEPLGQGQGIAVVAAGRDPVAAGGGVPGDLGPFDGAGAHDVPLLVRIVGMPRLTMRVIPGELVLGGGDADLDAFHLADPAAVASFGEAFRR